VTIGRDESDSQQVATRPAAETADKYCLYTEAVQDPEADVRFFATLYEQENGKPPVLVREDFCGTAVISCEWVQSREMARAICVDFDPEPLQWCREHLLPQMAPDEARRLELIHADVLEVETSPVDVILAPNTSICLLRQRSELIEYLSNCYTALNPGGIMVLDLYAGPEAQITGVDRLECDGFVCLWEQSSFDGSTNEAKNTITFLFPDGSRVADAFEYTMRMWSPAELSDALRDAGFHRTRVYRKTSEFLNGDESFLSPVETVDEPESWEPCIVGFR
jgi:hypothetical protein